MTDSLIQVTLVYSPQARVVREVTLRVPKGTTVAQSLVDSGLLKAFSALTNRQVKIGIWGRLARPEQVLRDQDRVEVYRELTVDPKMARRERFARQGAKTAGLFSKKRAGAKAGY